MEPNAKLMSEYFTKILTEALKDTFAKLDPKVLHEARQFGKQESRRGKSDTVGEQYMAEAALKGELVKQNIMMRAELREKKASQFPNIAGLLAGQAPGPIGMMGKMQRQASTPFRAVHEYKQKKDELTAFDAKTMMPTEEEQEERNRLAKDVEGSKKRAKSGFGKNIMGKRMQGMIGKVGKFMESSKGQGMMAGGMMGASILTMIIKKAMEASPMLQQMLKIMSVAMTLFLRPIGDFIGGMLKPVMLFFLREIAVPMLDKGKNFIKYGETFGKQLLGFLLKPIETIGTAITLALNPFMTPIERTMHENFDGIKEWMTEQKMNVIASDMGREGKRLQVQQLLNLERQHKDAEGLLGGLIPLEPTKKEAAAMAELALLRAAFPEVMIEFEAFFDNLRSNVYTEVGKIDSANAKNTTITASMGMVVGKMDLISEASGKVVTAFELLEETVRKQIPGQEIDINGNVTVTSTGGTTVGDGAGAGEMADRDYSDIYGTEEDNQPAWVTKLKHWSNAKMYDTPGKMLAAFGQQVRPMMKTGGEQDPKKLAEYNMITKGGTISVAEGIQAHFEKIERLTELMGTDMTRAELNVNGLVGDTDNMLSSTVKMTNNLAAGSEATAEMWKKIQAAMSSMKNQRRYVNATRGHRNVMNDVYNNDGTGYFKAMVSGGITLERLNTAVQNTSRQHGGMINEPIWGVGASGRSYTFGEAGPEMITPMNKAGGGIGPVTINVNVDNINSDVDLEKIKPVIERALHEVHARRGII